MHPGQAAVPSTLKWEETRPPLEKGGEGEGAFEQIGEAKDANGHFCLFPVTGHSR